VIHTMVSLHANRVQRLPTQLQMLCIPVSDRGRATSAPARTDTTRVLLDKGVICASSVQSALLDNTVAAAALHSTTQYASIARASLTRLRQQSWRARGRMIVHSSAVGARLDSTDSESVVRTCAGLARAVNQASSPKRSVQHRLMRSARAAHQCLVRQQAPHSLAVMRRTAASTRAYAAIGWTMGIAPRVQYVQKASSNPVHAPIKLIEDVAQPVGQASFSLANAMLRTMGSAPRVLLSCMRLRERNSRARHALTLELAAALMVSFVCEGARLAISVQRHRIDARPVALAQSGRMRPRPVHPPRTQSACFAPLLGTQPPMLSTAAPVLATAT
jgi:hypothetical protein